MYEPIFYCDPKTLTEYEKKLYVVSVGAYLFEKKNKFDKPTSGGYNYP